MSETNEAKEPGRTLYEIMQRDGWDAADAKWESASCPRDLWAIAERAVLDHYAPRLTTLETETRDLHRQLSELRVEAQAQRAGRVEAEHQRDVLMGRVGREVTAALVAAVPAKVAGVLTGAQHIDEAMQKALDDAVTRAEKAERERDEAIKTCTYLDRRVDEACALKESAMYGRDEARAEVARLTAALTDAEAHRKAAEGMYCNSATYDTPPCWAKGCGDCGSWSPVDREYRCGKHTPRPDAGLAGMAAREAAEPPKVERKPPFAWTDEARAKLVPGASVEWRNMGTCAPRRKVVNRVRPAGSGLGWFVEFTVDGGFLENCDPLTIEPPATQTQRKPQLRAWTVADKLRLKPGASVLWYCDGSSKATRIVVREVDNFGVDAEDEQGGFVSACFGNMDPETIVDAPSVPMLRPDLCPGDVVKDRNGLREWKIAGVPEFAEWAQRWSVPVDDNGGTDYVWVEWLDLSTRMRFGAKKGV